MCGACKPQVTTAQVADVALHSRIPKGAIDPVTQKPYSPPDGLVCLLCLAARAARVIFSKDKANMRHTHLPSKHKREWSAATAPEAGASAPAVQRGSDAFQALRAGSAAASAAKETASSQLPFARVAPPQRETRRVVIAFTPEELKRIYVAAGLLHSYPARKSEHKMNNAFLLAISGGTFKPPSRHGIVRIERDLELQCKQNIIDAMRADGVLNDRGQLPKPLISASADGSTEQSSTGKATISLRVYWLDREMNKRTALLAAGSFGFDWDAEPTAGQQDDCIVHQNADNLSRWVVTVLKDFQIVPREFLFGRPIQDFVFGFSCDSNATEISMVRAKLGCFCHNDPNHILALIMKGALHAKPNQPKLVFDTLGERMAKLARNHKMGSNCAALMEMQRRDGHARPLKMVSMNKTRWNGEARVYKRMILLRPWLSRAFYNAGQPQFNDDDWTVINQTNSFLTLANDTSLALQSRDLYIGEHVVPLLRMLGKLRKPETLPMLASDFSITLEQLNARHLSALDSDKLRLLSVQGLDGTCATTFAACDNLDPRVDSLRLQMLRGFSDRTGAIKDQLSNDATLLAIALDPFLKKLLEPGTDTFFPREHHTLGPKPPGPAGESWGWKNHMRAWSELQRLQRQVHDWQTASTRVFGSAAAAGAATAAGTASGARKRSRGDHLGADLAVDLGFQFDDDGTLPALVDDLKDEVAVRYMVARCFCLPV